MKQVSSIKPSISQRMCDTHTSELSKFWHADKKHLSIGKVFHFSISSGCDSREYLEKEKYILQTQLI